MAHILRITDGTTTKTFTSGDNMALIRYEPMTSKDGEDIEESASIRFTSTTPATNAASYEAIEKLFLQARNYAKSGTGKRVYIEFDPGTSGTAWRSMVKNGGINLNDEVLAPRQYNQSMAATVEWTRQPHWEGALTQIPLTNSSASDDTTGITVTNSNDAGTVQIETATIVGTITGDGDASVVITAAGMTGSPITTAVAVLTDDTPTETAAKMAAELNLDSDITDLFHVASSGADLILTRLVPAANDATLNIAYDNDTCTGLTGDATSADTQAGSTTAHENWVSIKAADVIGDLHAPIKLQMYNSKSGADATDEFFVHHNVYSTPASLDHIYEGEDATGATVTATPDGTSSGGFYGSLSYTATTETKIATWAISTGELTYMAGGRFAILSRWQAAFPYTDMWLRLKVEGANSPIDTGELNIVPNTRGLQPLDVFRLPNNLMGQSALKGVNLVLYAYRNQSGAHTIPLDYLQLSPIAGDNSWLHFKSVDNGVGYEEYFTHDATERWTYRTDTSSKIIAEFSDQGGEIQLVPGTVQKLYFLTCDYNGAAKVDQTWTVKLWYRPRRNAL